MINYKHEKEMTRVNGMIQENRVHKFQIRDDQMAKEPYTT